MIGSHTQNEVERAEAQQLLGNSVLTALLGQIEESAARILADASAEDGELRHGAAAMTVVRRLRADISAAANNPVANIGELTYE